MTTPLAPARTARMPTVIRRMFALAFRALGPQHWWPGETPFEVCVGAILTQNTAWTNVERAIANLRAARALDPHAIHRMPLRRLAHLIRPAGYFNVKAHRLRSFIGFLLSRLGGQIQRIRDIPPNEARKMLLSVNGVGPETADSILLYAAGIPFFVCDAYTRRILHRHGLCAPDADYHALQDIFHRALPDRDPSLYNEFHALFVAIGKDFCRPRAPRCDTCPLGSLLTPAQRLHLQNASTPPRTPARNPKAPLKSTPPASRVTRIAPRKSPPR